MSARARLGSPRPIIQPADSRPAVYVAAVTLGPLPLSAVPADVHARRCQHACFREHLPRRRLYLLACRAQHAIPPLHPPVAETRDSPEGCDQPTAWRSTTDIYLDTRAPRRYLVRNMYPGKYVLSRELSARDYTENAAARLIASEGLGHLGRLRVKVSSSSFSGIKYLQRMEDTAHCC